MSFQCAHLNCVKVKLPDRMTVWECLDKSTQAQTQMTDTVMCTKKKKKKWLKQCKTGMYKVLHVLGSWMMIKKTWEKTHDTFTHTPSPT